MGGVGGGEWEGRDDVSTALIYETPQIKKKSVLKGQVEIDAISQNNWCIVN